MQVIITRTEMDQSRQFNRKLATLLKGLPGTEEARAMLIKQSCEPIDLDAIEAALDPSQIRVTMDDDENLVVWINSDAIASGMDLMLDQYGIIIEIGVALYPIARLAKRLFTEFGEKMVAFGKRFERKPSPLLGSLVHLHTESEPVWQDARVEGVSFDGKELLVWTDGPVWHKAYVNGASAYAVVKADATGMAEAVDELGINGRGWTFTEPAKSE